MRPSFAETIRVLEAGGDTDTAGMLRFVAHTHQGGLECDNPGERNVVDRTWGPCVDCGEPWPCEAWSQACLVAVEALGQVLDRLPLASLKRRAAHNGGQDRGAS